MSGFKKERVRDLLLGFLAQEIRRLGDPRFEALSLTAVDVSPDLKTAWVYWSVWSLPKVGNDTSVAVSPPSSTVDLAGAVEEIGNDEFQSSRPTEKEFRKLEEALRGVTGLLKRRISEELGLRYTPNLIFRYDESLETASRIEYLVKKANK